MSIFPSYSPLFTLGLLAEHNPVETQDEAYLTLKSGKRDAVKLRSFLYLDLADSSRRAPSHKRKFSVLSKSTIRTGSADAPSVHERPPAPVLSTRRRTSKDSLRSIPSPKPAPSATLPDLPSTSHLPRPVQHLKHKKRPASIVVTSPLSPTFHLPRTPSSRSDSISSRDRRRSRMDALACLEGRSRAPHRVPRASNLRNNFMSFSDDEDDKSMVCKSTAPVAPAVQVEDLSAFADVEDEVDAVVPNLGKRGPSRPTPPAKPARKRRGTIESWFPLKSFIDLKDDDMSSWNWRSFIEIGGVA